MIVFGKNYIRRRGKRLHNGQRHVIKTCANKKKGCGVSVGNKRPSLKNLELLKRLGYKVRT